MNDLTNFDFEGHDVRVITINDEPWFVAADVCKCLGIKSYRDAISRLDDDEKDDVEISDAIGSEQKTTCICTCWHPMIDQNTITVTAVL